MRQIIPELWTLNHWPLHNCVYCVYCVYQDAASKKSPSFRQSLSSFDLCRKEGSAGEPLPHRAQARQWCFWLCLSCHWPENCKQWEVSKQVVTIKTVQWCRVGIEPLHPSLISLIGGRVGLQDEWPCGSYQWNMQHHCSLAEPDSHTKSLAPRD